MPIAPSCFLHRYPGAGLRVHPRFRRSMRGSARHDEAMGIPFIAKPYFVAHDTRMMRHLPVALLGAAALALGGCATAVPPVEVTRFHGNAVAGWATGT